MRIVTWNIHNGGSADRYPGMRDSLLAHNADVVILTEFRDTSLRGLAPLLKASGYAHGSFTNASDRQNGLYVAARTPFAVHGTGMATNAPQRALRISFSELSLSLFCLHIPGEGDKQFNKSAFWSAVLTACNHQESSPDIIIGDLNTGLREDTQGTRFACMEQMQRLLDTGWQDAWRVLHGNEPAFTWFSNAGNGFRLDHCLVKRNLSPLLRHVEYSHREREARLSDHSLLLVDLAL